MENIYKFKKKCAESYDRLLNMINTKPFVLSEIVIKTEITTEIIDYSCYEMTREINTECCAQTKPVTLNPLEICDEYTSVGHAKPQRKYTVKRSATITRSTDGKTLCTTCGSLIRNESLEQHKNKHLGMKVEKYSSKLLSTNRLFCY